MKLNPDCIRDVLLFAEENQTMEDRDTIKWLEGEAFINALSDKYGRDDVVYSLKQLLDSGLLQGSVQNYGDGAEYTISDIAPRGHEFIENIRTENNWGKTKEIASKAGTFALSALEKVATGVATAYINKLLN